MKLMLTLSLAMAVDPAHAQVGTRHGLTLDGARRIIASAQVEARKLNAPARTGLYRVRLNVPGIRPGSAVRTARRDR